jgi:hypothetical protein
VTVFKPKDREQDDPEAVYRRMREANNVFLEIYHSHDWRRDREKLDKMVRARIAYQDARVYLHFAKPELLDSPKYGTDASKHGTDATDEQ